MGLVKNVRNAKLTLSWNDDYGYTAKDFDDVHELAAFLREYPEIARVVGYVPKQKR